MADRSSISNQLPDLSASKSDRLASVLRGLAGAVPVAGGAIAEVLTAVIPNQQIDRVQLFLQELADRMTKLELTQAEIVQPENAALIEEGWHKARETSHQERIKNIARCVAEGISSKERSDIHKSRILSIVAQLDAEEVSLLSAYEHRSAEAFARLRPPPAVIGAPAQVLEANAMWEAMKSKLTALELISFRQNTKTIKVPTSYRDEEIEIAEVD